MQSPSSESALFELAKVTVVIFAKVTVVAAATPPN
jgi:hypothetical protein